MSSLMFNNSSLSIPPDPFRIELTRYVTSVNHIIFFVQAFICITGVLGNLLALIVINRKSLKNTSSAVFITYMAIFDSAVLLLHAANLLRPRGNLFIHCSLTYLTELSTFCANWVLVIITLERCVAVYSPFLAKRFCTIYSARYSMYILLTTSIIFFSGTFLFIYDISGKLSRKCLVHEKARLLVRIYQPILLYAVPDLFLLSNLFTVYALCRRRKRLSSTFSNNEEKVELRISDVNSNRKQRQLTIMLVTVSLSFYLFTTPAMVCYIMEYSPLPREEMKKIKQLFLFSQISVVLLQLNNATNFIFYCFAGQRFRHVTMQTFHYYFRRIEFFYHRYILCDKQYRLASTYRNRLNSTGHTLLTTRSACSSQLPRRHDQHRTSTI